MPKREGKYKGAAQQKVLAWVADVTEQDADFSRGDLIDSLRDGVVLCELLNKLQPGTVKKIDRKGKPMSNRENITKFMTGARSLGLGDHDLFVSSPITKPRTHSTLTPCASGRTPTTCSRARTPSWWSDASPLWAKQHG